MSWSLQYFFQDWDDGVDDESLLHADQEALPALSAGDINVEPSADIPDGEPVNTACTQTLSLHQTKSTQTDTADLRPSESRRVSVATESFQPQHDRQQPQSCHCDSASMQVALTEFRAKYDNDISTLQHDNKALHEDLRDLKNQMEILVDLKNKVSEMIEHSRNMDNGVRTDQQNIVDSPPTSPPHRLPFHTIDFDESTDNILHGMARASVSPAQPRPGRTIEPVRAQNSTRIPNVTPEVDPISRAAKDPCLTALAPEKACTLLACRLADIIFGPDVLAHSNLTGRDDRTALNPPDMTRIRDIIKRQFGHKFDTERDFNSVWKKCLDSIGTKCKNARKSAYFRW